MESIVKYDMFRKEFVTRQKAEEIFRKTDASERLQKAMKKQTYGYNDFQYNEGDSVLFKEDGKDRWSGPGKVNGNKIRIVFGGFERTVPACRLQLDTPEMQVVQTENEKKSETKLQMMKLLSS